VRIKTDFPRPLREAEDAWIPLGDGCRLSARVWRPQDSDDNPVQALLEYLPYRKDDATALRDSVHHPYFAGHGYASVRVDMRGSGASDGILEDEYLVQEQDDALDILAWLAAQPWCTGDAGMIGLSWGGFNALQVAARRPPELKAIVTLCSTDDRYADDVHYMGGCVLADFMLPWAASMLVLNARPPDPAVAGERWREQWLDRMERVPPFIEAWLSHQRRDPYWEHGSVCEDYASIACPVYAVGGWADAYRTAVLRLLAGLPGPRKGLIGPWAHLYPEQAVPGPAIGFLQECLRWWDHWLKGRDTGIMDEPMLRVWMQDAVPPRPYYDERPGRWVAEPGWPSPNVRSRSYPLGARRLLTGRAREDDVELRIASPQVTGVDAGRWGVFGLPSDLPPDQRAEDGRSLCFDSEPLEERLEILGFPIVVLEVISDRPLALLAARLCDIGPDGASTLVTRALLNLTHRESHAMPTPLEPGERTTVRLRMNAIAYAFPPGDRIRLALSPTYWPWAWPSPEPVTLTVVTGGESSLELPVRPRRAEDIELAPFLPPEGAAPLPVEPLSGSTGTVLSLDVASGRLTRTMTSDRGGHRRRTDGLVYEPTVTDVFTIVEGDPLSANVRCERSVAIARGNWRTRVEAVSTMTADTEAFIVTNVLDAFEEDRRVFGRTWDARIPRDLV
jgi:putative CocE/NonD family hydrolase